MQATLVALITAAGTYTLEVSIMDSVSKSWHKARLEAVAVCASFGKGGI